MSETEAVLSRYGRDVTSVFDLLGRHENDLTASLGFVLSRSPVLTTQLCDVLLPGTGGPVSLRLETSDAAGRTDLEVERDGLLAVVEAKRGWLLPEANQLAAYAPRVRAAGGGALVTLSQASDAWARYRLPPHVGGVPVRHVAWSAVLDKVDKSRAACRGGQRQWLDEFRTYLRKAVRVREPSDGWTYCVSVNDDRPGGGGARRLKAFVEDGKYFHPYGKSWPKIPPNFLAFRWHNQVQRIHRVARADVVPTLQEVWPDIPVTLKTARPHVGYELGPRLPGTPIPCGTNYRASRLWVLLDHLLVGPTLKDSLVTTRRLIQP